MRHYAYIAGRALSRPNDPTVAVHAVSSYARLALAGEPRIDAECGYLVVAPLTDQTGRPAAWNPDDPRACPHCLKRLARDAALAVAA